MPPTYQTPGVYVVEQNAFPSSIVSVETAVPAFIGYTPRTRHQGRSLLRRPTPIDSFVEFQSLFGPLPGATVPPRPRFRLTPADAGAIEVTIDGSTLYRLEASLRLFFDNGGGRCFIVSVGAYAGAKRGAGARANPNVKLPQLLAGLAALEQEPEPTIVLAPDATLLSADDHAAFNRALLNHAERLQSRVVLLDVHDGDDPAPDAAPAIIAAFRAGIDDPGRRYGAAYYPWLHTVLLAPDDLDSRHFGGATTLARTLPDAATPAVKALLSQLRRPVSGTPPKQLEAALRAASPAYAQLHARALALANLLPPSGAIAGIFTLVDNAEGVWIAPANRSLASVSAPTRQITGDEQETLNVPLDGKAINALRVFPGRGLVVWGARTLDGNSNDWRYVNVRRTTIMIEQSIKFALQSYVFAPNDASTWTTIRGMIENFLTNLWKAGALMGAKPDDAFAVKVGLGTTMTADDVLNGRLNVLVLAAFTHPAEFIALTFRQQMSTA